MGPVPMRCSNNGTSLVSNTNGGIVTTAATVTPFTAATTVYLGGGPGGTAGNVLLTNVCADATAANCAIATNRAPRPIVWLGDSTVAGNNAATSGVNVASNLSRLTGRTVYNWALAGSVCAGAQSGYQAAAKGRGFATVLVSCGTNDVSGSGGTTTAAVIATLTALFNEIRADGLTVIPTTILPRSTSAGWTGAMQTSLEAINTAILAYCVANGVTCVNSYAAMGGQGGDPTAPLTAEFAADNIHPNTVGTAHLATLAAAANP